MEVTLKILIYHDLDFDPLAHEERNFWNLFSQLARSVLLTGRMKDTTLQHARTDLVSSAGTRSGPGPSVTGTTSTSTGTTS